jgi:hypothetical protein
VVLATPGGGEGGPVVPALSSPDVWRHDELRQHVAVQHVPVAAPPKLRPRHLHSPHPVLPARPLNRLDIEHSRPDPAVMTLFIENLEHTRHVSSKAKDPWWGSRKRLQSGAVVPAERMFTPRVH